MGPPAPPLHLANSLASPMHLETSLSQLQDLPRNVGHAIRFESARLTQAAGILLRLPQEVIAQAIVILQRFWTGPDGGNPLEQDAKDAAAAAMYISAKPSGTPVSAKQILTVFAYLASLRGDYAKAQPANNDSQTAELHFTQGQYEVARDRLYKVESEILRVLGFQTHVALPYTLCVNYLQTLEVFQSIGGSKVAKRAIAHLNSALLSPQLLYLTHQPSALATAAIYLAAREVDVKLPEVEWWEVFDVDREELGFLVVGLTSLEGFASECKQAFSHQVIQMTAEDLRLEMEQQELVQEAA